LLLVAQEMPSKTFFQAMHHALDTRVERSLTVIGITLWVVFVCSCLVLRNFHYHALQREAAINALNITAWLELLWTVAAATLAVIRWRITTLKFLLALLANGFAVCILLAEFYSANLGS